MSSIDSLKTMTKLVVGSGHLKFKVHKRYVSETKETLQFGMIIGLSTDKPPATSP